MNGAGTGPKYLVEVGKTVQTVTCSFCGSSRSRHRSIAPWPFVSESKMLRIPFAHRITITDLRRPPPMPRTRPRCFRFSRWLDFSGCGGCSFWPLRTPAARAQSCFHPVIDPGKATVGFIDPLGVNLYPHLLSVKQSIHIVHDVVLSMNGAAGIEIFSGGGKTVQTVTCSFCGSSCSRHRMPPWLFAIQNLTT